MKVVMSRIIKKKSQRWCSGDAVKPARVLTSSAAESCATVQFGIEMWFAGHIIQEDI